tara:strand:+ start:243 stop:989 length:747 start_codon:yes stop_codon:yes gene_type:complete
MVKIDNFLFYTGLSIFFLCLFLTFIFFTPKQIDETENLVLIENLTQKEMINLSLILVEEGDIVLTKPKSFLDDYAYDKKTGKKKNRLTSFFFYSLFDKILISSMGDTYWHVTIYVGEGKINSLYLDTREELIDKDLLEHKYFKVLKVKTSEENKKLAIKRANEHLKNQDIYYSLKNGLLAVYIESTGSNRRYNIKEDELVCSSYLASIYREVNFDDKEFTHITPVDIELSNQIEVKFLINEEGFFIKK